MNDLKLYQLLPALQVSIDIWTFPISLGMVIFSYTSQIFLPSMEGNMVDRSSFCIMLDWTHLAAAVFKVGFSYIGFLTFGDVTQEVITNNLPDQALKTVVNLCLVAKALLSYSFLGHQSYSLLGRQGAAVVPTSVLCSR